MVFVLLQPLVVVLFNSIGPASIDLTGRVLPFFKPLVPKNIAQMRFFRGFYDSFRELRVG